MTEIVLTRDRSSGRFHKRTRVDGVTTLQTCEGDNLDDAGQYDVVPDTALDLAEPEDLCARCFPTDVGWTSGTVTGTR